MSSSEIDSRYKALIASFVSDHTSNCTYATIGHTDDVGSNEYNQNLSLMREQVVTNYMISCGVPKSIIKQSHYGEEKPVKLTQSKADRSFNRRVELIRFVSTSPISTMESRNSSGNEEGEGEGEGGSVVSAEQKNGIRIAFSRGTFSSEVETQLINGENVFTIVENTSQMRAQNMTTMTTLNEGLSSLIIICPPKVTPCIVDSGILIDIPINNTLNCSLKNIKFLNAQVEAGKTKWKEKNQEISSITIEGQLYVRVLLTNVCSCINFDYILEPPCFPMDTLTLRHPKINIDSMEIVIESLNSVLLPKKLSDEEHQIYAPKEEHDKTKLWMFLVYNEEQYVLDEIPLEDLRHKKRKGFYVLKRRHVKSKGVKLQINED